MAWAWDTQPTGTLRVQFYGSSATKSFAGVNASVLNSSPEYAVAQLNKILSIGGKSGVVNTSTKFVETSEVMDDE